MIDHEAHLKFKPDISFSCIKNISRSDVERIRNANRDILVLIAKLIEYIKDSRAQYELGVYLATHWDPCVRLALANNRDAPISLLKILSKDVDAVIATCAKENLKFQRELYEEVMPTMLRRARD